MHLNLHNKTILITGASRGIGEALARSVGSAGARVILHYNRHREQADALARQIGNGSFSIQADLGQSTGVISLFEQALEQAKHIDVLINNAGIAIHSPIEKGDADWANDLSKTLDVNLIASALLCKMAINHFIPRGGGIIINISSRAAYRGDTREFIAYAASKGGMVSLTKSIAKEFGKDGITAFNIAPGFVVTDMAKQFLDQYGADYIQKDIALAEITTPADLGPLVVLLASGLARHATGTTVDVNAGSYLH